MSEQAVTRAEVVAALRGWRPGAAEIVALCGIDPARGRFPDGAVERAAALWRVLSGDDRGRTGTQMPRAGVPGSSRSHDPPSNVLADVQGVCGGQPDPRRPQPRNASPRPSTAYHPATGPRRPKGSETP